MTKPVNIHETFPLFSDHTQLLTWTISIIGSQDGKDVPLRHIQPTERCVVTLKHRLAACL